MEQGARFLAYKGCLYGCGAASRSAATTDSAAPPSARFIQVKFGRAQIQKYSEKRKKKQSSFCPAYFVLQYKKGIDHLVTTMPTHAQGVP